MSGRHLLNLLSIICSLFVIYEFLGGSFIPNGWAGYRSTGVSDYRRTTHYGVNSNDHPQKSLQQPDHQYADASDVLNATLGFQKIYVISLAERVDHRNGLTLASAVSGIDLDFVDGVHADEIVNKTLPPNWNTGLRAGVYGCWASHIKALQRIVADGVTSALIMEDDVDWDVQLKFTLHDVAIGSRALLANDFVQDIDMAAVSLDELPRTVSPYGDGWDLLWLGHCGIHFAPGKGKAMRYDDPTVPELKHLRMRQRKWHSSEMQKYPEHTRFVMWQKAGVCMFAYAVTQQTARRLLFELGMERLNRPIDLELRDWCDGTDGRSPQMCLGTAPQVFSCLRNRGSGAQDSDIRGSRVGYREKAETENIRHSVRINMDKILRGGTELEDQYPDSS